MTPPDDSLATVTTRLYIVLLERSISKYDTLAVTVGARVIVLDSFPGPQYLKNRGNGQRGVVPPS